MTEEFIKWAYEANGPLGIMVVGAIWYAMLERKDRKEAERRLGDERAARVVDWQTHSLQMMENTMTQKAALEALKR